MKRKFLFVILFFFSTYLTGSSQTHVKGALQHAQDVIDKLCEQLIINPIRRDSLVETFKIYFEDSYLFKKKGAKLLHGLELARDADVRQILKNDDEFAIYQKFMHAMADHMAKIKAGHHVAGHH